MFLKESINFLRIFREKLPVYLILYITSRCNYSCKMCFYWKEIEKTNRNELTLSEIKRISKHFGNILQLSLTGGEPFLRDDLPEICSIFIQNNNPRYISIPTNASSPARIKALTEIMLKENSQTFFRIPLSLDGVHENHDTIRGHNGAFVKFMETYNELLFLKQNFKNLILDINIVFSRYNQDKIENIINFISKNLAIDNLSITFVRGNVKDPMSKNVSIDKYEKVIKKLISIIKKPQNRPLSSMIRWLFEYTWLVILKTLKFNHMIIPCLAGRRIIIISEKGDVFPCEISGRKMGNLREEDYNISRILNSITAKQILVEIKESNCFCTFECAINASLAFNVIQYPKMILFGLKNELF